MACIDCFLDLNIRTVSRDSLNCDGGEPQPHCFAIDIRATSMPLRLPTEVNRYGLRFSEETEETCYGQRGSGN